MSGFRSSKVPRSSQDEGTGSESPYFTATQPSSQQFSGSSSPMALPGTPRPNSNSVEYNCSRQPSEELTGRPFGIFTQQAAPTQGSSNRKEGNKNHDLQTKHFHYNSHAVRQTNFGNSVNIINVFPENCQVDLNIRGSFEINGTPIQLDTGNTQRQSSANPKGGPQNLPSSERHRFNY